ncbi:hypothetical protein AK812_SmicGene46618 [Symbiodinium microadriaticum]|uniref:Uncharacterized protein n=1 Tax=Symbiodinium microadriaticum TaxID=2951 RepID=A0A1Q9BTQ1_SYMMI|nr:hypothetical protein AK812_SmicGene46618 [Symbiodinium microadriaticum]
MRCFAGFHRVWWGMGVSQAQPLIQEPDGGRQGTLFDAMPETKEADPGAARVLGDMPLVDRLRREWGNGLLGLL